MSLYNPLLHRTISFLSILLVTILSGCASAPEKSLSVSSNADKQEVSLPYAELEKKNVRLTDDILFHYLLADIAAQRGRFTEAYNSYMHTAMTANESDAAV